MSGQQCLGQKVRRLNTACPVYHTVAWNRAASNWRQSTFSNSHQGATQIRVALEELCTTGEGANVHHLSRNFKSLKMHAFSLTNPSIRNYFLGSFACMSLLYLCSAPFILQFLDM